MIHSLNKFKKRKYNQSQIKTSFIIKWTSSTFCKTSFQLCSYHSVLLLKLSSHTKNLSEFWIVQYIPILLSTCLKSFLKLVDEEIHKSLLCHVKRQDVNCSKSKKYCFPKAAVRIFTYIFLKFCQAVR